MSDTGVVFRWFSGQDDASRAIALGHDTDKLWPLHDDDAADVLVDHDLKRLHDAVRGPDRPKCSLP